MYIDVLKCAFQGETPRTVAESAISLQRKMETYVDSEADARTLARKGNLIILSLIFFSFIFS